MENAIMAVVHFAILFTGLALCVMAAYIATVHIYVGVPLFAACVCGCISMCAVTLQGLKGEL